MVKLFDTIYCGCYYYVKSQDKYIQACLHPIIYLFGCLLNMVPSFRKKIERDFNMSVPDYFVEFSNGIWKSKYMDSRNYTSVGYLISPLFIAIGADIILVIWHICGCDFSFIPLNRIQKLYIYVGIPFIFSLIAIYLLYDKGDRSKAIINKFRKKNKREQRRAFYIYIATNIVVGLTFCELLWGSLGILSVLGI